MIRRFVVHAVAAIAAATSVAGTAQAPAPSEAAIVAGLSDPARAAAMTDHVVAHPDAVDPMYLAFVSANLFARGDRLRAAYWFYVFQIRTRPWADADTRGDGASALRASLNAMLGETINGWLGGDVEMFRRVPRRAIETEPTLPLYRGRPDGTKEAAWQAAVVAARRDYAKAGEAMLSTIDAERWNAQRRENGLPVGPLESPGAPLP